MVKSNSFGFESAILLAVCILIFSSSLVSAGSLNERTYGSSDAKITIELFVSLQCPFCARWYLETWPLIRDDMVAKGDVKLIFKYLPLNFHNRAMSASIASECAGKQGEFFEYIELIFKNQNALNNADLIEYAKELGLNEDSFEICMSEGDKSAIELDISEAEARGIFGTPTFLINHVDTNGERSYEFFKKEIDRILEKGDEEVFIPDEPIINPAPVDGELLGQCTAGCLLEGKCLPFGLRLEDSTTGGEVYCSINGLFAPQKGEGDNCQNNYECTTNQCNSGKCIDLEKKFEETNSLIERLLSFLRKLFGGK